MTAAAPDQVSAEGLEVGTNADTGELSALPGECGIPDVATEQRASVSLKGIAALALMMGSLAGVAAFGIHRFATSGKHKTDSQSVRAGAKPAAASVDTRKLELPSSPSSAPSAVAGIGSPRIPALLPDEADGAEPIGIRRTGASGSGQGGAKPVAPEDAPILLVSSRPAAGAGIAGSAQRPDSAGAGQPGDTASADDGNDPLKATSRNLDAYQRQLQGLLNHLTKTAELAEGTGSTASATALLNPPPAAGLASTASAGPGAGLFGGQLQKSATPTVTARQLGNVSLTLPQDTSFTCALTTKVISATSGMVGCQVQRNVYGADGRVVLVERGSHVSGEYRIASVKPGMVRIPVLWTRIRTPLGVVVDIDSPATGALGESGIDGYVDNRWTERIGAAMLLSLIDDSVKLVIQNQANERRGDTIVLPSTTANTSKLAEKVLDSTINIPPLVYQNQGGIVGIYVARDVDFSSVYELRPTQR